MSTFHIALTGHRPNKLAGYNMSAPFYKRLRQQLMAVIAQKLETHDVVVCHCGMALGADIVWGEAIANMRFKFGSRVRFVAHIPCHNQESRWPQASQDHYHAVLNHSDDSVIYHDSYTPSCMQDRNVGMIRNSDLLIAIWDGTPGGTGNTVRAAKDVGHQILRFHPDSFRA